MYIRVKRQKSTIFLHVEPTETVLEVKQKLQELVEKDPQDLLLLKIDSPTSSQGTELLDAKKLADFKIQNDDLVAVCYRIPESEGADSAFEAINIEVVDPHPAAA